MFILVICVIAFTTGLLCGYGLGRNGSVGGASRPRNSVSESGFARAEEAAERAIKANEDAAATIQRMRDIVNRHNHDSDDTVCKGKAK